MLQSLGDYQPQLEGLKGGEDPNGKKSGGANLDEFGRDRTFTLERARDQRRAARVERRKRTVARLQPEAHEDPLELEAVYSGAEDR